SWFFHNESKDPGAALDLSLEIPVSPLAATLVLPGGRLAAPAWPAIGAAATVHLPDGRRLVAQVDGGNGHSGKRSPDLHFGLGRLPASASLPVDLAWRDARGAVHRETLHLSPGRHTVLLGEAQGKES